jgi:hypothetical protein
MNERQQLEADYDKAKEGLDNAAADLANLSIRTIFRASQAGQTSADTDLRKTVATLAKSQVDLPKARANLERARANCHRTMLALEEFDRTQANQCWTQSSGHFVRNVERPQVKIGHDEKSVESFAIPHRDNLLVPNDKPARALLLKHTVMLFALVLAFLQYYFLDVRLQIERLPSGIAYMASQQRNLEG